MEPVRSKIRRFWPRIAKVVRNGGQCKITSNSFTHFWPVQETLTFHLSNLCTCLEYVSMYYKCCICITSNNKEWKTSLKATLVSLLIIKQCSH